MFIQREVVHLREQGNNNNSNKTQKQTHLLSTLRLLEFSLSETSLAAGTHPVVTLLLCTLKSSFNIFSSTIILKALLGTSVLLSICLFSEIG